MDKQIYITVLLILMSIITTQPPPPFPDFMKTQFVYSLEGVDLKEKYNNGWGTSTYLSNYKYPYQMQFDYNDGSEYHDFAGNLTYAMRKFSFELGIEAIGLKVPYLQSEKDNITLIPGRDIIIDSQISGDVFPINYFNLAPFDPVSKGEKEKDLKFIRENATLLCNYTNPGPTYTKALLNNVKVDSVVNLLNWNLGLVKGEKGIKLMKMSEFTITYDTLDKALLAHNQENNFTPTDHLEFKKLVISKQIGSFSREYIVGAQLLDNNLIVYNVTDYGSSDIFFKEYAKLPFDNEVTKLLVYGDMFIVITKDLGFYIITKNANPTSDLDKYVKEHHVMFKPGVNMNVKDMAVLDDTLYLIVSNEGMVMFDLKDFAFYDTYFKHPHLYQIDSTYFYQMHFIGVLVDNKVNDVPEFFIEFAHNFADPGRPLVNKVFVSEKKIPINDIASDDIVGITYILDTATNSLVLLTRGVPNGFRNYNLKIDYSDYHKFDTSKPIELFLLAGADIFLPHLVMRNGQDYVVFGNFNYPKNRLQCRFKDDGKYFIKFASPGDCSTFNGDLDLFNYRGCWHNTTFHFDVKPDPDFLSKLTALWVLIPICVVAIIAIIITVVCCKRVNCCRKGAAKDAAEVKYFQQHNKEVDQISSKGGSIQISVLDNKL